MINKKLKSYLEYKLVHPKPVPDNQALLKLKALQKSRQKSREKTTSTQKSHKHSQSFAETTQSTLPKLRNPQREKEKDKFSSINSQIKQLQSKVDILLSDKNPDQFVSLSRRNQEVKLLKSREKSRDSRQKSSDRKLSTTNPSLLKNERLRNSFLSTYNSHETESHIFEQPQSSYRSLIIFKMEACKLLTNLNIEPQKVNFFEKAESREEIFSLLQDTLAVFVAQKVLDTQYETRMEQDEEIKALGIENQRYKTRCQHLENIIHELREQKTNLQQKHYLHQLELQKKQTQIYQLKMLADQSQTQLLRSEFEHRTLCQQQKTNLKLDYERRIYEQINAHEQQEQLLMKLRMLVTEQVQRNRGLEVQRRVMGGEIGKWERELVRVRERYEMEKMQRKGVEEEKELEVEIYNQYKGVMRDGYFSLVQRLTSQLNQLHQTQSHQSTQLQTLKRTTKQQQKKLKEYESDYLSLNDDFTRDVREWVTKEEYFEREIKELRAQLVDAHQSIARYSGMLAVETGKGLAGVRIDDIN